MKNLIIFSTLVVMAIINFTGCSKAQERPSKPNKKIQNQVVSMEGLVDITKSEHQDSQENISFKNMLIAKLDSAEKRDQANSLLAQNKLFYMFMEGKVLLLEFMPATSNKHASASATLEVADAASDTEVVQAVKLHTFESLMALKTGDAQVVESLKTSSSGQNHFVILAEIAIQTGVLENETTDYNEKKSTLKLTDTPLEQANVLLLKGEIKADASGDALK